MGILEKFIPIIDYSKLGFDLTAIIGITAEGGHLVEVEELLAKEPNVTAVYDVTGEFDVITVARFRSRSELNSFIKRIASLEHVKRTYTMLVLNVVKETHSIDLSKFCEELVRK